MQRSRLDGACCSTSSTNELNDKCRRHVRCVTHARAHPTALHSRIIFIYLNFVCHALPSRPVCAHARARKQLSESACSNQCHARLSYSRIASTSLPLQQTYAGLSSGGDGGASSTTSAPGWTGGGAPAARAGAGAGAATAPPPGMGSAPKSDISPSGSPSVGAPNISPSPGGGGIPGLAPTPLPAAAAGAGGMDGSFMPPPPTAACATPL